jgi:hypothetical protein
MYRAASHRRLGAYRTRNTDLWMESQGTGTRKEDPMGPKTSLILHMGGPLEMTRQD